MKFDPDIKSAMQSISEPEVQAALKTLARYGLGVCVPHQHTKDVDFAPLPRHLVQVEEGLQVKFLSRDKVPNSAVPVAWRWHVDTDAGIECAVCTQVCTTIHDQSTGEHHYRQHGS